MDGVESSHWAGACDSWARVESEEAAREKRSRIWRMVVDEKDDTLVRAAGERCEVHDV